MKRPKIQNVTLVFCPFFQRCTVSCRKNTIFPKRHLPALFYDHIFRPEILLQLADELRLIGHAARAAQFIFLSGFFRPDSAS